MGRDELGRERGDGGGGGEVLEERRSDRDCGVCRFVVDVVGRRWRRYKPRLMLWNGCRWSRDWRRGDLEKKVRERCQGWEKERKGKWE